MLFLEYDAEISLTSLIYQDRPVNAPSATSYYIVTSRVYAQTSVYEADETRFMVMRFRMLRQSLFIFV